jgi:anti-sigma factor RsiW
MKHNSELELQSYLDGELSSREAARVADWLARDAEARDLLAELQMTKKAVAGNEMEIALPESREFYWSKIQRQIEHEAKQEERAAQRAPVFSWRKFVAPFVGACAMLAILMIAQFRSGSAFDELTSTSDDMEAVTFHDHTGGMTVVWLQERGAEASQDDIRSDVDTQ